MRDSSQRTEKATPRRQQKAREEGRFPASPQFVAGVQILVFAGVLSFYGAEWLSELKTLMRAMLGGGFGSELTNQSLVALLYQTASGALFRLGSAMAWVTAAAVGAQLIVTRGGLATAKLRPDFARLNPVPRLSGMMAQNTAALVEAAVLLPPFLIAVFVFAAGSIAELAALPLAGVETGSRRIADTVLNLFWRGALALFLFGCFDLYRQRRAYARNLRMTKQEIREEYRELEGNPQIKSKIRRLQRDAARKGMMKAIPGAAAVIVNPTHFAVAIQYAPGDMAAPRVVAKGRNYLAARIRALAEQHRIPVIENVPLAQALYKTVDVGQEIPPHLYRAVAEILAYIYRLMNGRNPGPR